MRDKIITISNLNGPLYNGDKQTINNYYGTQADEKGRHHSDDFQEAVIVEEAPPTSETICPQPLPSFHEAIPEWLRSGRMEVAWDRLRKAGFLNDDYRLAEGVSKAAAKHMAECFCNNRRSISWKPFENFWGLKDLRWSDADFSKKQEKDIDTIFFNL